MGTNTKPRLGRAIIDHLTVGCKICLLSFDMEVGGEYCGPLSLSGELIEFNLSPQPRSSTKDVAENVVRHPTTFHEYIRPPSSAIWDDSLFSIHGLRRTDPQIEGAAEIRVVWARFLDWFHSLTRQYSAVVLVAWNGAKCGMKWLWKLTQAPRSPLCLPNKLRAAIYILTGAALNLCRSGRCISFFLTSPLLALTTVLLMQRYSLQSSCILSLFHSSTAPKRSNS